MGSGKSTVGKILSGKLSAPFYDLDSEIEREAGLSITEIFDRKGEIYFRKLEREVLLQMVGRPGGLVLALGGGTPCYAGNDRLLKADGVTSFYLKTSVENLVARLALEKAHRPMIADVPFDELASFIGTHLFERDPYYRSAHHIIDTSGLSPEEVASAIDRYLKRA